MAYPFNLGVASGDPRPGGFVLWTRLAPRPLAEGGRGGMGTQTVRVRYEVATDRRFAHIVRRGSAEATPALAHTVHPEVTGLEPDRVYYYRFNVGGHLSPVGRSRTTPVGPTAELAYAFVSCQAWGSGYFTAYRHLAQDYLDLVVHLGDYIYEYGIGANTEGRTATVPDHFAGAAVDLARYRLQYALTKSDPDLQLAHRRFPWLMTLDDHDVANDWSGENSAPEFLRRRAAAFRAWYEHLPVRAAQRPRGVDMQIYRRLRYGDLATFHVLDTRQYRDLQACGGDLQTNCDERLETGRTMMGAEQEAWLRQGLGASTARWDVLANQATMGQNDRESSEAQLLNMDIWDGYAANRDRVLRAAVAQGAQDLVVITGDKHRRHRRDRAWDSRPRSRHLVTVASHPDAGRHHGSQHHEDGSEPEAREVCGGRGGRYQRSEDRPAHGQGDARGDRVADLQRRARLPLAARFGQLRRQQ
jgi:alkaline phosphatase D